MTELLLSDNQGKKAYYSNYVTILNSIIHKAYVAGIISKSMGNIDEFLF